MAIDYSFYGTEAAADEYFMNRLHSEDWFKKSIADRRKSLLVGARIIDSLKYAGKKLDPDQPLQFPRVLHDTTGGKCHQGYCSCNYICDDEPEPELPPSTDVPCEVEQAAYEIAYAILVDCRDPELELEALSITSQGLSSVRTTYARGQIPIERIVAGIPSMAAWRLLAPFLTNQSTVKLKLA